MMTEQAKVPAIRFAGFTDPWEQRKLGELALTYSGGTPSAGNSAYYGGEIPFIRSAEIDCDSTELSLTVAGLNNSSAKLVDKGMVLYAMYGATSGEVAISKIKGAINQAILAMDASDMAANRFIAYWLRRQKKSITETFLQGGQGNLSGAIIKELGIPQPSLDEQRQIGSFFSNLDDLITLHQRKYDKLVIFKKSMLEKMFPKDGESVPEIRFAGFTDPWEQRKLGEFGSVAMCKRIYKEQTSEQGDVPFFKIGTFGADPDAFISNELFEDYKRTYPYPTPGTLLISAAGSIGRIVEYQGEKAYFQDSNIVWLEHDHRLNDAFLKPLYSKIEWGLEGSTIKRLYNKDLLSAEVTIPDGREQKEIGQFFAKLDSLITLHQRKLELLQNIKKSLLDKMFV